MARDLLSGFEGHFPPAQSMRKQALLKGVIVLDANVLLDIYRFSPSARDDLFGAFEAVRDRIFIPHQVANEFHRNRISAVKARAIYVNSKKAPLLEQLEKVRELLAGVIDRARSDSGQISKIQELVEQFEIDVIGFLENAVTEYDLDPDELNASHEDPVFTRLNGVITSQANDPPDEVTLQADKEMGGRRLGKKIPPGYGDDKKGEDAINDYLWWAEVLRHSAEIKPDYVFLVSNDTTKDDLVLVRDDKKIGPHPYLVNELREASGAILVHASTAEFLRDAAEYLSLSVSQETLAQAEPFTGHKLEEVIAALRKTIGESVSPMRGATLSSVALAIDPTIKAQFWYGTGSFRLFVQEYLPGVAFVVEPSPGYFYIPDVHELPSSSAPDGEKRTSKRKVGAEVNDAR